jgi:asparagine synthase (glutamine-hydrolysing)
MCGIVGQLAFSDAEAVERGVNIIRALTSMMARRGPDDEGLWSDEQRCCLGFRRLAVLDLTPASHQPMVTEDRRHALVYNGELYNFRELRRDLELEGVRFRSNGDTEVVLYALARWGIDALSRFNGMFALGFYDAVGKRLFLARDHAGIKPLYYSVTGRGVVFASQYDQIMAHPWNHGCEISPDALGLYLRLGYIPAPYALLRNTHMLEAGAWLEVTGEGLVHGEKFFEFPIYRDADLRGEGAYEAVDAAVTAAVRRQLVSDVPIGTFLSGGIDSPLVAATMRAVSNKSIRGFTVGTNGDALDESGDAAIYAREIGIEHVVEHITPATALEMLDDVVTASGEPFADHSIFPTAFVSRVASRHVKVMLSGDGGDELFWGYSNRFAWVMDKLIPQDTEYPRLHINKLLALGPVHGDTRWPGTIGDIYRLKHTQLSEIWLKRILPDLPEWPAQFSLFTYNGLEPDQTAQWMRWNEFVGYLTMMLLKVDRGSMHHSLEVRVPLLDKEVIDVASRVEWRSCLDVKRKIGKLPLRHALARRVKHQTSAKRGFTIPMDLWLRTSFKPVLEDELLGRQEILGLPLNRATLRTMFDQHLAQQANYDWFLWVLLSLRLWEKRHLAGQCID